VLSSGKVRCWGESSFGVLGSGKYLTYGVPTPTAVVVNDIHTAISVSVGWNAGACAVLADGGVQCWGNGFGSEGDEVAPVAIIQR
jgi:hypothetical protein